MKIATWKPFIHEQSHYLFFWWTVKTLQNNHLTCVTNCSLRPGARYCKLAEVAAKKSVLCYIIKIFIIIFLLRQHYFLGMCPICCNLQNYPFICLLAFLSGSAVVVLANATKWCNIRSYLDFNQFSETLAATFPLDLCFKVEPAAASAISVCNSIVSFAC